MEDQENNNRVSRINVQERKQHYRNLLNQIEDIEESNDVGLQVTEKIANIICEANRLNDQYQIKEKLLHPEEILLDTLVISSASNILVKCTRAVDIFGANYEPLDFASKIVKVIKTNETLEQLDFLKLIEDARGIVPNTIEYSFLYGALDISKLPQIKEKRQRSKETQEKVEKKQLTQVKNLENNQVNEDTVKFLVKVLEEEFKLNNEVPLKYYDFVVDTNNFSATVENMFYCSFLISDGRASLSVDENGVPLIKPSFKKELKSFRAQDGVNTQAVISLEMSVWNKLKSREGYVQKHKQK